MSLTPALASCARCSWQSGLLHIQSNTLHTFQDSHVYVSKVQSAIGSPTPVRTHLSLLRGSTKLHSSRTNLVYRVYKTLPARGWVGLCQTSHTPNRKSKLLYELTRSLSCHQKATSIVLTFMRYYSHIRVC